MIDKIQVYLYNYIQETDGQWGLCIITIRRPFLCSYRRKEWEI